MGRPLQPGRGQRPGSRVARVSIRDDLCNSGSWSRTTRIATRGFNPLPHGATSATRKVVCGHHGPQEVSIPYLTGRPLQLFTSEGVVGRCDAFQSPTSRGDLCNRHCELGRPPLASPGEPIVVILSSGPNSEGGGQPPPSEGRFEVDHPTGALHSWNLISDMRNNPAISSPKPKNSCP